MGCFSPVKSTTKNFSNYSFKDVHSSTLAVPSGNSMNGPAPSQLDLTVGNAQTTRSQRLY